MTPEKETPTRKGVEEVVADLDSFKRYPTTSENIQEDYVNVTLNFFIEHKLKDYLRTTLLARDAAYEDDIWLLTEEIEHLREDVNRSEARLREVAVKQERERIISLAGGEPYIYVPNITDPNASTT